MGFTDGARLGPYQIIRKLGEGGMGVVYEAVHETIERRVAIKVLHPEFAREPEIAGRFINEARAANRVNHPGLVQISDYSQHVDGQAYIVMEYLEGERLGTRLEGTGGRLPICETLRICCQVGSALAAAHERGIVHRDLKPDNIMIVPDRDVPNGERAKILDFGLAKLADRPGTKSGVIMGTPQYMSPEQCRGSKSVTSKSDVYSLGVMLFELLAGRLPFAADNAGELIAMHLSNKPPRLISVVPDVPQSLSKLVDQMLVKNSAARPSMAEVVNALESISADLPIGDSQPSGNSLKQRRAAVRIATEGASSGDEFKPTLPREGILAGKSRDWLVRWQAVRTSKRAITIAILIAMAFGVTLVSMKRGWNGTPKSSTATTTQAQAPIPIQAMPTASEPARLPPPPLSSRPIHEELPASEPVSASPLLSPSAAAPRPGPVRHKTLKDLPKRRLSKAAKLPLSQMEYEQ